MAGTSFLRTSSLLLRSALWPSAAVAVIGALALGGLAGLSPSDPSDAEAAPLSAKLAVPAGGELAFVVESFDPPYYHGADDCPEGPAKALRENFTDSLDPAERERLLKPENAAQFQQAYREYARGRDGSNICTNFDRFPRPPGRTVQGAIGPGLDLDDGGDAASGDKGCTQRDFTSPAGETGIDNQTWRALGCFKIFRGTPARPPDTGAQFGLSLANGENAQVIVIRGIDSLTRDDDVEVIYGNSRERAMVGPDRRFLYGATYALGGTPGGPNVMKGHIVGGVLEARTPLLRLRNVWNLGSGIVGEDLRGARGEMQFRRVRLRLHFLPDGSIKGMVGGFQPVEQAIFVPSVGGLGAAVTADFDCPVLYATLKKMADGDRDPRDGSCRSISAAYEIKAVPAFVTVPRTATATRAKAGSPPPG